ncbi:hypothetical protein B0E43_03675 [Algoriphagus sp. A40]|nr:hypothetical protein B0E43_03675 [Algoriphagus sp. A40]
MKNLLLTAKNFTTEIQEEKFPMHLSLPRTSVLLLLSYLLQERREKAKAFAVRSEKILAPSIKISANSVEKKNRKPEKEREA